MTNFKLVLRKITFMLPFLLTISSVYSQSQIENTEKIDSYIKYVLNKELQTEAGLVVAVIKDDNIMFEKAYGQRDALRNLPATTDTPFYIASVTKSFVSFLAKILEEKGVLDLNIPITKYLGNDFKFENNNLDASKINIIDLLTHQSKIINDAITWRTAYTGEESENIDLLLRLFKKSTASNDSFHYTNNGYILTAIIMEKVTGKSWKSLLNEEVFKKLSLNKTSANPYNDFKYDEPALGHTMDASKTILGAAQKQNENSHAAGGIFASLFDMEKWLFLHMHQGKYNGKQVFPKELFQELHKPKIKIDKGFFNYKRDSYDLGWYHGTYENEKLVHCFGGFPGGYRAHMSYMPEKNIGVIALTNLYPEGIYLPEVVANYIYDTLLGKDSLESKYEEIWKDYNHILSLVKDERVQKDVPMELLIGDSILGDYRNQEFGSMSVFYENGKLKAKFGLLGLVKTELVQVENNKLKMLNADFFSRNDFLDITKISSGNLIFNYGDNQIALKKVKYSSN